MTKAEKLYEMIDKYTEVIFTNEIEKSKFAFMIMGDCCPSDKGMKNSTDCGKVSCVKCWMGEYTE